MPIRLPTENCGRARLCGMGRARPFRVHHSRPWSRGDAGRRATWGFPAISPTSSVLSQFSLRSAAISHPELELFYGRCPGGAGVEAFNRSTAKVTSFKGRAFPAKDGRADGRT